MQRPFRCMPRAARMLYAACEDQITHRPSSRRAIEILRGSRWRKGRRRPPVASARPAAAQGSSRAAGCMLRRFTLHGTVARCTGPRRPPGCPAQSRHRKTERPSIGKASAQMWDVPDPAAAQARRRFGTRIAGMPVRRRARLQQSQLRFGPAPYSGCSTIRRRVEGSSGC